MLESHLEETTKATNGIGLMVRNTVSAYHEELKKEKDKNAGVETHNKYVKRCYFGLAHACLKTSRH